MGLARTNTPRSRSGSTWVRGPDSGVGDVLLEERHDHPGDAVQRRAGQVLAEVGERGGEGPGGGRGRHPLEVAVRSEVPDGRPVGAVDADGQHRSGAEVGDRCTGAGVPREQVVDERDGVQPGHVPALGVDGDEGVGRERAGGEAEGGAARGHRAAEGGGDEDGPGGGFGGGRGDLRGGAAREVDDLDRGAGGPDDRAGRAGPGGGGGEELDGGRTADDGDGGGAGRGRSTWTTRRLGVRGPPGGGGPPRTAGCRPPAPGSGGWPGRPRPRVPASRRCRCHRSRRRSRRR